MKCPRSRTEFYGEAKLRAFQDLEAEWAFIPFEEDPGEVLGMLERAHVGFAEVAFRKEVDDIALENFMLHESEVLFFLEPGNRGWGVPNMKKILKSMVAFMIKLKFSLVQKVGNLWEVLGFKSEVFWLGPWFWGLFPEWFYPFGYPPQHFTWILKKMGEELFQQVLAFYFLVFLFCLVVHTAELHYLLFREVLGLKPRDPEELFLLEKLKKRLDLFYAWCVKWPH